MITTTLSIQLFTVISTSKLSFLCQIKIPLNNMKGTLNVILTDPTLVHFPFLLVFLWIEITELFLLL